MKLLFAIVFSILTMFQRSEEVNILFIGNSLTYTNDLPALVVDDALKVGVKVKTKMIAYPNYAIVDHINDGEMQKLIKKGDYDYVIVQQGPSSQNEGREMLIESGAYLSDLCQKNGSKLVYFMVWPSTTYYSTIDKVILNHRDAAQINNALLCPVGEAWKKYFESTGDYSLYGNDGFHPSLKGSKLAAEVIVKTLFQEE